ncbi:MAG TPA: acyltransferase [Verrucomicrobiae bacterium]|jgi:peptidoglycan/LPS O-acetylase OafA/YrhL|nr:acyltransferase [Verrucomicrobiae bacterium]
MADLNTKSDLDPTGDFQNAGDNYFRPRYVRSLDGIRGVGMVVVCLGHLSIMSYNAGFIAVEAFFVLSGFLITWLLLREWNDSGAINFKDFYYRRALRLLPTLVVMLLCFAVYTCMANPPKRIGRDFQYISEALFYWTNWGQIWGLGERLNFLAQTWSLSIEEQFYILWPPILLLLLRRTASKRSLLWWTVLVALCLAFTRVIYVELGTPTWNNYWRLARGLDTRADSLLVGCAIALAISERMLPRRRWLEWALFVAAAFSIYGLVWLARHELLDPWMYEVGWLLASVFSAILIVHLVYSPEGIIHWILGSRPLVYLGVISYGFYVWHFPIFRIMQVYFPHNWRLIAVPVAAVATMFSYYVVERPCLRLKRKFNRPAKAAQPVTAPLLVPADR